MFTSMYASLHEWGVTNAPVLIIVNRTKGVIDLVLMQEAQTFPVFSLNSKPSILHFLKHKIASDMSLTLISFNWEYNSMPGGIILEHTITSGTTYP